MARVARHPVRAAVRAASSGLIHTNGIHLAGGIYDVTIGAGGIADGGDGGASALVSRGGSVSLSAPGGGAGGCYGGGLERYTGHPGGSGGGGAVQKAGGAAVPDDGIVIGHAGGNAAPSGYNPGGGESRFYAAGGGAGYTGSSNVRGNHGIGGSGIGGDGETALQSQVYRRPWGHPGRDGTGSGGGGGGQTSGQTSGVGGKGGCGVLIVRYLASLPGMVIVIR